MGKKKSSERSSVPTLDLHGARVEDVFDLMDRFLRREEELGSDRVRILHGKGTGKVKEKSLEYCRISGRVPEEDKVDSRWGNPGSFLLYL